MYPMLVLFMNILRWIMFLYLGKTTDVKRVHGKSICLRLHGQMHNRKITKKAPIDRQHLYNKNVSPRRPLTSTMLPNAAKL
jgi:hypothetical protein